MSAAIETLDTQIEKNDISIKFLHDAIAYTKAQIANLPRRNVVDRIKFEHQINGYHKSIEKNHENNARLREKKATYQHEEEMLVNTYRLKRAASEPTEQQPGEVTLDPSGKAFLEAMNNG